MGNPFEIFSSPAKYGDTNNALLLKIWWWISGKGGSSGVPFVPPTVDGVKVVGIQEVDTFATGLTTANTTVQAGALSIGFNPSSDFTGTIQGAAWTGAKGAITRTAQPGNTCPAFVIARSAGSYDLYVVTPA